jgi:quercetin dioxygenase-like cupin family protein
MTDLNDSVAPAIVSPDVQDAVWFLGALLRIRVAGAATGRRLAVVEHEAGRASGSPVHRHDHADETFFVLDGELRVEVAGQVHAAGPGAVAFLPRTLPHAVVVTSSQARYLTLHTPAGWDEFARAAGTLVAPDTVPPIDAIPPDPAALAALASRYGIEILGPPPSLACHHEVRR